MKPAGSMDQRAFFILLPLENRLPLFQKRPGRLPVVLGLGQERR
jgi:hypothetical protein